MNLRCECGQPKRPCDPSCGLCIERDKRPLAPAATAIMTELRITGPLSWNNLRDELLGYSNRVLQRGMAQLVRRGYVQRSAKQFILKKAP